MVNNLSGIRRGRNFRFVSILIFLVMVYQRTIGILLPNTCRFTPTCSEYTIEALTQYGILKGGLMSIFRILRCNPFLPGGYDPVIPSKRIKNYG